MTTNPVPPTAAGGDSAPGRAWLQRARSILPPTAYRTTAFSVRSLVLISVLIGLLVLSFVIQLELLSGPFALTVFLWLPVLGLCAGAILAFGPDWPAKSREWDVCLTLAALPRFRYLLATVALACAVLAGWEVQTAGSSTIATASWVVGIILILTAAVDVDMLSAMRAKVAAWRRWWWHALVLAAILIMAAALRLVDLGTIPGFIHNDEANDGLQARAILLGQVPTIFSISSWSQLPMLVHAWYAMFLWLFGDSLVSQRLGSVVFGLLSILAVAWLGKELFSWRAGLIAAALLAVYHFHIHFSRVGIQVISGDLAPPLTFLFLIRALKYRSRFSAVSTGIMLTLDIHAYFGSRICFIVVPLFLLSLLISGHKALIVRALPLVPWAALGFIISIAPIGIYILHNWNTFVAHTNHETIFSNAPDIQIQLTALFGTHDMGYMLRTELWRTIQTFFYLGDSGLQYGIQRPIVDPISSALLCAVIAYAIFRIKKPGFSLCLIAALSVLIIGGAITINMPYWPRLMVILPFIALLIAAFLDDVWQALEQQSWLAIPATVAALGVFAGIATGNYQWYFQQFVPASRQTFIAAAMDVGNYLRALPTNSYVYGVSDGPFYMNNEVVRFLAPHVATCTVAKGLDRSQCPQAPGASISFLVFPGRAYLIPTLKQLYPHGSVSILHTYNLGQSIYIFRTR